MKKIKPILENVFHFDHIFMTFKHILNPNFFILITVILHFLFIIIIIIKLKIILQIISG